MKSWGHIQEYPWSPHPLAKGVMIKKLITKKDHGLDVTCMLVLIPKGAQVPEHIHEGQDDMLYPLKGKGVMWVDGNGTFSLEPGIFVRVEKGTRHKIEEVTEEILFYDVFCPATV